MARRKAKTSNVKKTTNVSTTAAATKMTNNSMIKDPGGKEEEKSHPNHHNKILTNRTNGVVSVNSFLKATKDQLITSSSSLSLPSSNASAQQGTSTVSTVTTANTTSGLNSSSSSSSNSNNNHTTATTNDSKYLHKKFKKFCATVDSNQQPTNINNNISSNNFNHTSSSSSRSHSSSTNAAPITNSSSVVVTTYSNNNNNNSEIVENKNSDGSWRPQPRDTQTSLTNYSNHNHHHHQQQQQQQHQFQSVPSPPKHFHTTEEEKQLVKDIIDINNENFMHQSANHSVLTLQSAAPGFLIASASSGGPLVTVTTLGNHNSNYQASGDLRGHKVIQASQEPPPPSAAAAATFNSSNQTPPNGNFVIISGGGNSSQLSSSSPSPSIDFSQQQQQQASVPTSGASTPGPGRYICPYCQLNCAKPSVLQKHIRAHTNERPYPCTPCGFAFKTKSNLYKHCRSRAHIQRCNGEADLGGALLSQQNEEDGCSLESGDIDEAESSSQLETMNRLSSPSIVMESQMNGNFGENSSSSSSNSSSIAFPVTTNHISNNINSSSNNNNNSSSQSDTSKPYKPKFHNYKKLDLSKATALVMPSAAALVSASMTAATSSSTPTTPSTPSFFSANAGNLTPQIIEERISRIISDNEAIIDNVEALLQKKYHKITGIQRNLSTSSGGTITSFAVTTAMAPSGSEISPQSNSKLALALLKQQQQQKQHDEEILRYQMTSLQPLNLIKSMQEPLSVDVGASSVPPQPHRNRFLSENVAPLVITSHQQETAAVLVSEKQQQPPTQLVIPTSHPQNPEGSIIKDLLLNSKNFGAVDGEGGDGTYTCPTCKISFRGADILKYHLICHCGDENIMSRSAPMSPSCSSSASSPYSAYKNSPSSLSSLAQSQLRAMQSSRTPSSLQKIAKSQLRAPKPKPENIVISPTISAINAKPAVVVSSSQVKNPLPSPGPLLGNTRLVDKPEQETSSKKQKLDLPSTSAAAAASEKKVSPFFDVKFMHDRSTPSKNFPGGGSFTVLESSESQAEPSHQETSPNMMRQGMSGGSTCEVPIKRESHGDPPPITPKLIVTITPTLAPTLTTNTILQTSSAGGKNHFQFPQVTVYNPLTLSLLSTSQPQSIVHGSRIIPYVPGIPGPNTMAIVNKNDLPPPPVPVKVDKRLNSPSLKQNGLIGLPPPREISPMPRPPNGVLAKKHPKPFNFARIADSIDATRAGGGKTPEAVVDVNSEEQQQTPTKPGPFLRPTTLALKPGTFTPKQHHGITPTANTLPLISPETPRPSKSCVQLYLNGHAYTYLGLKSSTKPFYCTVNKPQPTYIQNQHKLSMYSNWQIYSGNNPNILDLSPYAAMSLYDSRQRPNKFSLADDSKSELVKLVEMQSVRVTVAVAPTNYQIQQVAIKDEQSPGGNGNSNSNTMTLVAPASSAVGFENNNEEYTYIRGRGRGKYICQECGIRCKKPSMLKKHIRTHTDLRPYTCSYCEFSFKTKGNLTKHMKSKAHFKKCTELGLNPIPTMPDDDPNDMDDERTKRGSINGRDNEGSRCDSETEDIDSDDDMDDDSDEDTDESKSRMPEHEAAQLLLSLSNHAASSTRPSSANSMHQQEQQQQQQIIQLSHNHEIWQERITTPAAGAIETIPRSRIIFSNTKTDFDLLSHGKYYSKPTIPRAKEMQQIAREIPVASSETNDDEDDDDMAMPMDLTKKPQSRSEMNQHHQHQQQQRPVIVHVSDVITKISDPAVLLNQLVSNTDKLPSANHMGETQVNQSINFTDAVQYTESFLPQEYITERALKDARIKQIQQAGKMIDYAAVMALKEREYRTHPAEEILPKMIQPQQQKIVSNGIGMMDALAELASKSDKLEIKSQSDQESKPTSTVSNAKNVASEYLKLTQQKLPLQRTAEEAAAAENGSDQEAQEPPVKLLTPQTIVVGEDGFHKKPPTSAALYNNDPLLYSHLQDDSGRPVCVVCSKVFQKASQLKIHMNIHYMERKFRCEACGVSFRTQGHLQKHERSVSHQNKVNMSSTFGVPSVSNPRPFKCKDCKIAFRIHGHLAKHLRSKMHVLKLECLQKLPFGTYAEMERAGFNLTDIDTSDCDNSLMSLRSLAKKLNEKDPSKLGPLPPLSNDDSIDGDESGMNDNYDSDSSDTGIIGGSNHHGDDETGHILKRKIEDSDPETSLKRIRLTTTATIESDCSQVPSNNNTTMNDDDRTHLTCAKN